MQASLSKYYQAVSKGGKGFPRIVGRRSVSPHPLSPDGVVPMNPKTNGTMERKKTFRNIQVPESSLLGFKNDVNDQDFKRPKTAPNSIYRYVSLIFTALSSSMAVVHDISNVGVQYLYHHKYQC